VPTKDVPPAAWPRLPATPRPLPPQHLERMGGEKHTRKFHVTGTRQAKRYSTMSSHCIFCLKLRQCTKVTCVFDICIATTTATGVVCLAAPQRHPKAWCLRLFLLRTEVVSVRAKLPWGSHNPSETLTQRQAAACRQALPSSQSVFSWRAPCPKAPANAPSTVVSRYRSTGGDFNAGFPGRQQPKTAEGCKVIIRRQKR
jgi:hypothetical protein